MAEAVASTSGSAPSSEELCQGCEQTMIGFGALCKDQDRLLDFLLQHGVIKRTIPCAKCGKDCHFDKKRLIFHCWAKDHEKARRSHRKAVACNYQKSVRVGTWFSKSVMTIDKICLLTDLWLLLRHPKHEIMRNETDCAKQTVTDWSSFCREVCISWVDRNSERLGGEGVTVEVDEAKFGKRKYNRGRLIEGKWVFAGIERGSKRVFIVPVERRNSATLLGVIDEWIMPGTTVLSDCWKAYNCLEDEGYVHQTVNHSKNFVDPDTGAHTQNIERLWRDVRGGIPRYGTRRVHFVSHLAEFMYKRAHQEYKQRIHNFFLEISYLYPPA